MISLDDLLHNFGFAVAAGLAVAWVLVSNRTKASTEGPPWKPRSWELKDSVRAPSVGYLQVTAGKAPRAHGFLTQLRLDTEGIGPRIAWLLTVATIGIAILIGSLWSLLIGLGLLGLLCWQTTKTSRLVQRGSRGRGRVLEVSDGPTFFSYGTAQVALTDPKLGDPLSVAVPWWPIRSLSRRGNVQVIIHFDPQNPQNNLFVGVEASSLPEDPEVDADVIGDSEDTA